MFVSEGFAFAFGVERDESIDLKRAKNGANSGKRGGDTADMRLVGIDFNPGPGPDAEDRLRRIFPILVRLADDDLPILSTESTPERSGGEEG